MIAKCQLVYIKTFGCQMNEHDSERVRDLLSGRGYRLADKPEDADVILFNTCSVREHAEDRVYGKVGGFEKLKKTRPDLIIGILGCMAEARKDLIFRKLPHVDFLCGPADLDRVPGIIDKIKNGAGHIMCLGGHESGRLPEFSENRCPGNNVYVKIIEGCNNFCSYCVVPYVRGRERSRPSKEILDEVRRLIEKGAGEITLLGQNVNSYGRGLKEKIDFVGLLKKIDRIASGAKIGFVTSHPKDAGVELFRAMRDLKSISKNLHLPMQSGSDKILKRMNRGYSSEKYKKLVEDFRRMVKEGTITTDIIVGFPGETKKDFEDTLEAIREIEFDAAYIFKYSPRPFAAANKLKDDVPMEEKERRHAVILETQKEISRKKCR
ncbi:MAG: tRNA (N6-isopentenyl adenosine(37)-C2)-methylthiotransferase MiaB [Candidatus Omnitrophota bacterium]